MKHTARFAAAAMLALSVVACGGSDLGRSRIGGAP